MTVIFPCNWFDFHLLFQISKVLFSDSSSESVGDKNKDPNEESFKKPR
jgi:hypothetical protein